MMACSDSPDHLPLDLGDGLILRRSREQDAQPLADFCAMIHSDEGPDHPDLRVGAWTHDLLSKPHPTFTPQDFTLVEESASGKIISAMNLIPQVWAYGDISFNVGRPELVGTLPEYRNRGLVRRQFDVIHQWSAGHGDQLQAITGIPYYYRLFGYEMALNLSGGRTGFAAHVPRLPAEASEPYSIRPVTTADIPFLDHIYNLGCQRSLVRCLRDEAIWLDELSGKSAANVQRMEVRILETLTGEKIGYFIHPFLTWGDIMPLLMCEILPGWSWVDVTPTVIRYLESVYQQYNPEHGEKKPFGGFAFILGEEHPVYHVIPDSLPRIRKPYAWYIRVPDLPGFLTLVAPVLERNLAESSLAGYSGEIKISFYRQGLRLVLDHGHLSTIEAWRPTPVGHAGNTAFPPHTFLQLLFGYRSLEQLKSSFPDCWTDNQTIHVVLDALFPHHPSDLWPVS